MGIVDAYWSVTTNWNCVVFDYTDATGQQGADLRFNSGTNTAVFSVSLTARQNTWKCTNITLYDFDGGSYIIKRSAFPTPAEFDVPVGPTVVVEFLYAPTANDNIIQYSVNTSTGALTLLSPDTHVVNANQQLAIAAHPSGKWVYDLGGTGIHVLSVNQITGFLTNLNADQDGGFVVCINPAGTFLYTYHSSVVGLLHTYSINQTTGLLTFVANTSSSANYAQQIKVDPSGKFLYVACGVGNKLVMYNIDPVTGIPTEMGSSPISTGRLYGVSTDPAGNFLYVCDQTGSNIIIYSINPSTGALTPAGTQSTSQPISIIFTNDGKFAYVSNHNTSTVSMYSVNLVTGALTLLGTVATTTAYASYMTLDSTGTLLYVSHWLAGVNGALGIDGYSINASTGALTHVSYDGYAYVVDLVTVQI
jgi:6-phosphogluconolactonase